MAGQDIELMTYQQRMITFNPLKEKVRPVMISLLIFSFCLGHTSYGQTLVEGSYLDQNNEPIPFASILLLQASDSTMVTGQVSDPVGHFIIETSEEGEFFISASAIGYQTKLSPLFRIAKNQKRYEVGLLLTEEQASELDEIVIQAERPFFEQQIDRTIVNVKSNISVAGGTALDVLQRSPGVTVDKMNNLISLSGKQGVKVMINGRLSRLPTDVVVQMLGGMNADNIEKIELITTPPSKYDAEGDAGMINIILSKSEDAGSNGSLSMFAGYGRRPKYGTTLNLNHRNKDLNVYADYSFRDDYTRQFWNTYRSVATPTDVIITEVENVRDALTRVNDMKLGIDWSVTPKTELGGVVSYYDSRWDMDALADIDMSGVSSAPYSIQMSTLEENDFVFVVSNLHLIRHLTEKSLLSMDVDYMDFKSLNPTSYTQDYYDEQQNLENQELLYSIKDTPIRTWVGKIDFATALSEKLSLEAGVKETYTELQNEIQVESFEGNVWLQDTTLTSDADMRENIAAGYLSMRVQASEKLTMQLGVRYEHTLTNMDTRAEADVVDRNFGKWFPSVFLNKKVDENNSWVLSYSRRITRPSFDDLAPFVIFNDPNSFFSGNVNLLPSFTDAIRAEYRYKSMIFSLQYSHDENSIAGFQPKVNNDSKLVSTAQNLDYMDSYSSTLALPWQPWEWLETQLNVTASYFQVKSSFYSSPVELSTFNMSLNGFQKFKLKKNYTFELSYTWQSEQLWGVSKLEPFGAINLGFEKKFRNSALRISFNDIFQTNIWKWNTTLPEENLDVHEQLNFEPRQVRVSYSVNFGNNRLKTKRSQGGSQEERSRFRN